MKYKIFHEGKMYQADEHDPTWVVQMSGIVGKFNGKTYDTVEGAKVLLSTELEDNMKQEIYEGDIITNASGVQFIVTWQRHQWLLFNVSDKGSQKKTLAEMAWVIMEKYWLIGNIYENPELLSPQT